MPSSSAFPSLESVLTRHPYPDLVVIGATPAGLMAAIAAARLGGSAVVFERSAHLGGLPANGLGATDIGTRGATGGLFAEFLRRIRAHYVARFGPDSAQVRDCREGHHFEPHVAETVLQAMVAEHPNVIIVTGVQFDVAPDAVVLAGRVLTAVVVTERRTGRRFTVPARAFVDATYEGDLAAACGAPFRLGREGVCQHREALAGRLYKYWEGPVADGSTGEADEAVQAYNFRVALTRDPANRRPIERPASYQRDEYASLVADLQLDRATGLPGAPRPEREWSGLGRVVNLEPLPNGKFDANNQHAAFVSTDLPEENWPWPTADWAWRDAFAARLRDYTLGLLWFCQHDPELPTDFRAACAAWGLAADEYQDNGNFPRQVYVREARRILGEHVFTAQDAMPAQEGGRPPVHADSVTASHYALDSHAVRKREPGRVHLDGFFSAPSAPYTVPYRVILPQGVDGLLVPVAASASHVGYSTLRMEPCWMALGEAAGTAAALARRAGVAPREVDVGAVQRDLLRHGAVLLHFADVRPGHPHYEAVQLLGLRGLLPEWEARPDDVVRSEELAAWREALALPPTPFAPFAMLTRAAALHQLWGELSHLQSSVPAAR
ncbi:FAD-dependent oxidoreductase [Opitutus sp. ER46]|uniref:FAD-dependent oxidoreductase n=1 Tax=Opitutus sp. ER46 TaxID=2161864 RepID=UPI000D2FF345|nr:FAD-dependent oxidoreductase [Opitutus sp. ER46]PTX98430.1 FAD-dependent oxidoreductase [Opitutus sp. ER46]